MHLFLQQVFSGLADRRHLREPGAGIGDDLSRHRTSELRARRDGDVLDLYRLDAGKCRTAVLGRLFGTLVVSFLGGLAIERIVIRPVENAPVLAAVVVTIGLLLIFNALAGWLFTYTVQDFPSPFPDRPVFGALMTTRDLGVIGVTLVMLVLLFTRSFASRRPD